MAAQPYGLIATFNTAPDLYHAAEKVRDAGYRFWDCITPCPVHGLDKAMGLKRSIVPRISLAGGITGFCTGMLMIWWTSAVDYPLTVGGKQPNWVCIRHPSIFGSPGDSAASGLPVKARGFHFAPVPGPPVST